MQKGSEQEEVRAQVQRYYSDASCIKQKGSNQEETRVATCMFYEDSKLQKRLNVYKKTQRLHIENTKNYKNTKRKNYGTKNKYFAFVKKYILYTLCFGVVF